MTEIATAPRAGEEAVATTSQLVARRDLSAGALSAMHALLAKHFDGVTE